MVGGLQTLRSCGQWGGLAKETGHSRSGSSPPLLRAIVWSIGNQAKYPAQIIARLNLDPTGNSSRFKLVPMGIALD